MQAMNESRRPVLWLLGLVIAGSLATQWWGRAGEARVGNELARLAGPDDIVMLASDTCTYCAAARTYMKQYGVRYAECSIERDAACAQRYGASLMQGTPVMLVRGQYQLGFNPQRVRERLAQRQG